MRRIPILVILTLCICMGVITTGCGSKGSIKELCQLIERGENEKAKEVTDSIKNLNQVSSKMIGLKKILTQGEVDVSTPLYSACRTGNTEMIAYLLEKGADPDYTTYALAYPLEILSQQNDIEGMNLMLSYGADPNKYTYLPPAYQMAILLEHISDEDYYSYIQEILNLVDHGAKMTTTAKKYSDYTLLHLAARQREVGFMQELMQREEARSLLDAQTDQGETALMMAVEYQNEEICQYLLEQGASTDIKDLNGKTALDYAEALGNSRIIELLS